MVTEDALFESTPVELHKGQYVTVDTIWGHERGMVLGLVTSDFPMVRVLLDHSGIEVTLGVARVVNIESINEEE